MTPPDGAPPLPPGRLLRVREAATLLGVSEQSLYREIQAGRLPVLRGAWHGMRIAPEQLAQYVADLVAAERSRRERWQRAAVRKRA